MNSRVPYKGFIIEARVRHPHPPNFNQPPGNVQSATFGQITSTRFATSDGGSSRQLQISAKFLF